MFLRIFIASGAVFQFPYSPMIIPIPVKKDSPSIKRASIKAVIADPK